MVAEILIIFFPCFFNKMAVFLAPKLAKTFHGLIAAGNFSVLWKTTNITLISKDSFPFLVPLNYKPISNFLLFLRTMKFLFLEGFIIFFILYKFFNSIKVWLQKKNMALLILFCCWHMICELNHRSFQLLAQLTTRTYWIK